MPRFFGINQVDILGSRYDTIFQSGWLNELCADPAYFHENLLFDCEHDLSAIHPAGRGTVLRVRSRNFIVELDGGQKVRISRLKLSPTTGKKPILHQRLAIHDVEDDRPKKNKPPA